MRRDASRTWKNVARLLMPCVLQLADLKVASLGCCLCKSAEVASFSCTPTYITCVAIYAVFRKTKKIADF